MDNRDRDKLNKHSDRSSQSNIGKNKSDSSADFGKNIGRSEEITTEPNRRAGSEGSGMKSSGKSRSSNLDRDVSSSSSSGRKGSQDGAGDLGRGPQGGKRP